MSNHFDFHFVCFLRFLHCFTVFGTAGKLTTRSPNNFRGPDVCLGHQPQNVRYSPIEVIPDSTGTVFHRPLCVCVYIHTYIHTPPPPFQTCCPLLPPRQPLRTTRPFAAKTAPDPFAHKHLHLYYAIRRNSPRSRSRRRCPRVSRRSALRCRTSPSPRSFRCIGGHRFFRVRHSHSHGMNCFLHASLPPCHRLYSSCRPRQPSTTLLCARRSRSTSRTTRTWAQRSCVSPGTPVERTTLIPRLAAAMAPQCDSLLKARGVQTTA